jgi:signal transduction histidine kinase
MAGEDDPWRELDRVAESLAEVSVRAVREMVTMPGGADLVARTVQVVGLLGSLLIDGRRGAGRREADELRELVGTKGDFLRLTTHELRRPLGLLNGYLSMIREGAYGDVSEKLERGLQMVQAGAQEMQVLIDGLAEIARLEDRAGALRRQPTRLGHLVSDAVAAIEVEAAARGIDIDQQVPEPDILIAIDRNLIRIAVTNLLNNAIKYAPERSTVGIVVRAGPADPGPTIAVSDQGRGIDADEAERIFERWHRAPDTIAPGMGLGLYIVRQIVALHGGRVTLESTPGQGSTFGMVLPEGRHDG